MDMISDSLTRKYARINYGPWDRLAGNKPFVEEKGQIGHQLQKALQSNIPVNICFEQGIETLKWK